METDKLDVAFTAGGRSHHCWREEHSGEVPSIAGVWEISGGAQTVWSLTGWRLLEAPQTQKTSLNSRKLQNMQFDEYYKNPAESGFGNITVTFGTTKEDESTRPLIKSEMCII